MYQPTAVALDNSPHANCARYQISVILNGNASAGTNVLGLRKQSANAIVRLYRVQVVVYHAAAGLGVPLQVFRATTVAGGSLITAADVPKKDTNFGNATLEVRTGAVTGTKANQALLAIGGATVTGSGLGGPLDTWEAPDLLDQIVLRGDEGLIFSLAAAGDADDRYGVTVSWEEEV